MRHPGQLMNPTSSFFLLKLLLLLSTNTRTATVLARLKTEDYYCGLDWIHASDACPKPCPTGNDDECTSTLGSDYGCFYFTGCAERVTNSPTISPTTLIRVPTPAPTFTSGFYCGTSWIEAMLTCDTVEATPCNPNGNNECNMVGGGASCYDVGVPCSSSSSSPPLQEITSSELIITLDGVTNVMDTTTKAIFITTVGDLLTKHLEKMYIAFEQLQIVQQQIGLDSFDYIDITVTVNAKTRTIVQTSLDTIATDYINQSSRTIVSRLKSNALKEDLVYFVRLDKIGVGLGMEMEPTVKPTRLPTGKAQPTNGRPTGTPTPPPTRSPTLKPTEYPSGMPSESPSRAHVQSIVTHTRKELRSLQDKSYGYIFNVCTTDSGPAIILTGMDFYSDYRGIINYELWSRLGTFVGHRGNYESWDLLSSGTLTSYGAGNLISIPEEAFVTADTTVSIPGGGGEEGTRSFYLTLNTKDLVYQPFRHTGNQFVTKADSRSHSSSPELEIYNGEAVLEYPFPQSSQSYLYRAPQEFVGALYYDRVPCKPFSMYGVVQQLPCPTDGFPTHSPTSSPPTGRPAVGPKASSSPTKSSPTGGLGLGSGLGSISFSKPTVSLTTSAPSLSPISKPSPSPTSSFPRTNNPTSSPVEFLRINIVMTLRGIPDEGYTMNKPEEDAFAAMFTDFLNNNSGMEMVVELVNLWHQQIVLVDDDRTLGTIASTKVVPRDGMHQQREKNLKGKKTLPQISALQLIMIIPIQSANLPPETYGSMAVAVIEENEAELLGQLKGSRYFTNVHEADAYWTQELKKPTLTTGSLSYERDTASMISSNEPQDDDTGPSAGAIAGAILGTLWLCFSIVGLIYLRKVRSRLSGMKETLNWTKANVLSKAEEDQHLGNEISTRSLPMGNDTERASSDKDESHNEDERKVGLTKSGALLDDSYRSNRQVPLQRSSSRASTRRTNSNRDLKSSNGSGSMRTSLIDRELPLLDLESNQVELRASLRGSINNRELKSSTKLRKSLLDKEFEAALLDDSYRSNRDINSGRPPLQRSGRDLRASTRHSSSNRDLKSSNGWGSMRKSLIDQELSLLEAGLHQVDHPRSSLKKRPRHGDFMQDTKSKSLLDKEFEAALLDDSYRSNRNINSGRPPLQRSGRDLRVSTRHSSSNRDLKSSNGSGSIRKSLIDQELSLVEAGLHQVDHPRSSLKKRPRRGDFMQDIKSKSLDKEFEAALLDANRDINNRRHHLHHSSPSRDFGVSMRRSSSNTDLKSSNGSGSMRKSLIDREPSLLDVELHQVDSRSSFKKRPRRGDFMQDMELKPAGLRKSNTSYDNLTDLIDTKNDQPVKEYKPSSTRKSRPSNKLTQSAKNDRDLTKQSLRRDISEDTNADLLRSSASTRAQSRPGRPLSQSVDMSALASSVPAVIAKEATRASTGDNTNERREGKKKRRKTTKMNTENGRAYTGDTPDERRGVKEKRPETAKMKRGSRDKDEEGKDCKKPSTRKSSRKKDKDRLRKLSKAKNSDERSSMNQGVHMPKAQSNDNMQRLAREARQQVSVKNRRSISSSRGNSVRKNDRTQAKSKRSSSIRRDNEPTTKAQVSGRQAEFRGSDRLSSSFMIDADTGKSAVCRSTKIQRGGRRHNPKDDAAPWQSVRRSGKSKDISELKRTMIL